jgi:hypothetical protein
VKVIGYLADSAITLILFVLTVTGTDLRFIVGAVLLIMFIGELSKAFIAFVEPINETLSKLVKYNK